MTGLAADDLDIKVTQGSGGMVRLQILRGKHVLFWIDATREKTHGWGAKMIEGAESSELTE